LPGHEEVQHQQVHPAQHCERLALRQRRQAGHVGAQAGLHQVRRLLQRALLPGVQQRHRVEAEQHHVQQRRPRQRARLRAWEVALKRGAWGRGRRGPRRLQLAAQQK
jgi:hypothetical protein